MASHSELIATIHHGLTSSRRQAVLDGLEALDGLVEQLETLRSEMQFINDAAMSFHKGEEGKARALNVIGARSGNALLGSNPASRQDV